MSIGAHLKSLRHVDVFGTAGSLAAVLFAVWWIRFSGRDPSVGVGILIAACSLLMFVNWNGAARFESSPINLTRLRRKLTIMSGLLFVVVSSVTAGVLDLIYSVPLGDTFFLAAVSVASALGWGAVYWVRAGR